MNKHLTVSYNKSRWGDLSKLIDVLLMVDEDFTYYIGSLQNNENRFYVDFIEQTPSYVEDAVMRIILSLAVNSDGVYMGTGEQFFYVGKDLNYSLVSEDEITEYFII